MSFSQHQPWGSGLDSPSNSSEEYALLSGSIDYSDSQTEFLIKLRDEEVSQKEQAQRRMQELQISQYHCELILKKIDTEDEFGIEMKKLPPLIKSSSKIPEVSGNHLFAKILKHPAFKPKQKSDFLDQLITECNYDAFLDKLFEKPLLEELLEINRHDLIHQAYIRYCQQAFANDQHTMQLIAIWLGSRKTAKYIFATLQFIKKDSSGFYKRYAKNIRSLVELQLLLLDPIEEKKSEEVKAFLKSSHPFFKCCAPTSAFTIYELASNGNKFAAQEALQEKITEVEQKINQDIKSKTNKYSHVHLNLS